MSDYVFSPAARADLRRIWRYSYKRWSEHQADSYLQGLRHAAERIAADPRVGKPLDDIRPGYFKLAAASHTLYYRLTGDGTVEVVRILHQRMDPGRHL